MNTRKPQATLSPRPVRIAKNVSRKIHCLTFLLAVDCQRLKSIKLVESPFLAADQGTGSIHPRRRRDWEPKEIFYIVSYRSHNDHKYIHKYPNDNENDYES